MKTRYILNKLIFSTIICVMYFILLLFLCCRSHLSLLMVGILFFFFPQDDFLHGSTLSSSLTDSDSQAQNASLDLDFENEHKISFINTKGVVYKLKFTPAIPSELEAALRSVSKLERLSLNQPSSKSALMRRVSRDLELFEDMLAKEGYLEAKISAYLDDPISHTNIIDQQSSIINSKKEDQSLYVIFSIHIGPLYKLGKIKLFSTNPHMVLSNLSSKHIEFITKLKEGEEVNLEKIQDARKTLMTYFKNKGYPKVFVKMPVGEADSQHKTLSLEFEIDTEYRAVIDRVTIHSPHIKEEFVKNRITLKKGDIYNQAQFQNIRNTFTKTNIIAKTDIEIVPIDPQKCTNHQTGDCPVEAIFNLKEAPSRSIGIGARYSTSIGVGGQLFWHHNNLFGGGEHFGATFRSSVKEQFGNISLDLPDIGRPLSTLNIGASLLKEQAKPYHASTMRPSVNYTLSISPSLRFSSGMFYETSHATSFTAIDVDKEKNPLTYNLRCIGFSFMPILDYTNDLLDPSKGIRLSGSFVPHLHTTGESDLAFTTLNGKGAAYLPIYQTELGEEKLILAGAMKFGYLVIKNFKNTASPTKRYYSGGPGSLRSYAYQKAGPLDQNGVPLGGKGLIEWTGELRYRASDTVGFAAFFEAGCVTRTGMPQFVGNETLYGFGFGVRYYSGIGPIRFDIGTPLKRRKNRDLSRWVDSPLQITISIGQAF